MMKKLHLYTIMGLDTDHLDEICDDIRMQYESGIATCALFSMTLVPEGNPPVNKVEKLCMKYDLFRRRLSDYGIPNGILVQATIGHGWVLSEMFPYQRYVNFTDGAEENVVCPYDEGFREYIYGVMKTIAQHNPDHIMVDDDFRLLSRDGGGCACPLHMKRFHELSGTDMTCEELKKIAFSDTEDGNHYARLFLQTQRESLIETAEIMRRGIDSVNPTIPGSFCCCGYFAENGAEIANILAGKGNPSLLRIHNGRYTAAGTRFFSDNFFRARSQIEKVKDSVDIILAETDTCPQNRYSTSAMSMHTHFTGSLLEGAQGAKQWITRRVSYEPESGIAYRKVLAKYADFYEALAEIVPTLTWKGYRIPLLRDNALDLRECKNSGRDIINAWGHSVLERFGLPMYFSSENGGALCLEGEVDTLLSDAEILEALRGPVILASDSAKHLIDRGFGKYLGVDIRIWTGETPSIEQFGEGAKSPVQPNLLEIVKTDLKTKELSGVYHTVDKESYTYLFPGVTEFTNELGGQVFTFCGTPDAPYGLGSIFSFLNQTRKKQLASILERAGQNPVYYPGDEEVYFKAAKVNDGSLFCAVFNLGFDAVEQIELVACKDVSVIERLMPDGSRKKLAFEKKDGKCIIDTSLYTLEPAILFLS